jgi:hypothetical protein
MTILAILFVIHIAINFIKKKLDWNKLINFLLITNSKQEAVVVMVMVVIIW